MDQRDMWNQRYAEKGAMFGAGPNQFVADRLGGLPPGRVLDLGAGQGRNAVWLAQQGHTVTAVDLSDVAVEQGRAAAAAAGVSVEFIVADLAEWEPPTAEFDLVLLSYLQGPEAARKLIHEKAARALVPGGRVFLVAHHLDNLNDGVGGPSSPDVLFTESDLASDFSGFEIETNEKIFREVDQDGATGMAIDVLFIARKPR